MDSAVSEQHSDKLVELTTLIKSNKRTLVMISQEANLIIERMDKYQNKKEVKRELRRWYVQAFEEQQMRERTAYYRKMEDYYKSEY